jgi:tetratricopeptide (TPR) repeat protein
MTKKKSSPSSRQPAQKPAPLLPQPPLDPRSMEKVHADLQRMLNERQFGSAEEVNQFMQDLLQSTGGKIPEMPPTSPLEQAQEVMYQAWSASSRAQRIKLARQALTLSPDCADAYVLLAEENTETPAEARALYEAGLKAGERALGKETFKELEGQFWGFHETRPYMRARYGLAQVLWHLGETHAAATHLKDMLRLNPNDNQGVRYFLANVLLETGDEVGLEKLLAQYKDDWSANWKYTRALLAFRKAGSSEPADTLLREAIEFNAHVPAYLLGQKKLPKQMPPYISPGQESEAVDYAVEAMLIWMKTEGALLWLRGVQANTPPQNDA